MNEAKKGVMKAAIMTFTLTLVATIIGGVIVDYFIKSKDTKTALAQQNAAQPPRQVVTTTTTLPQEEQVTG